MLNVFRAGELFVLGNPFHPLVCNPLISHQDRTSQVVDSRIHLVFWPAIKPVESRSFFRFHRQSNLRKNSPATKLDICQVQHERHKSEAAKLQLFRRAILFELEALAVIVTGNGTPDPVVHNLIVLAGMGVCEQPETRCVLYVVRHLHGFRYEPLVQIPDLGSPQLGIGNIGLTNSIGSGSEANLGLGDDLVSLLLADQLVKDTHFRFLVHPLVLERTQSQEGIVVVKVHASQVLVQDAGSGELKSNHVLAMSMTLMKLDHAYNAIAEMLDSVAKELVDLHSYKRVLFYFFVLEEVEIGLADSVEDLVQHSIGNGILHCQCFYVGSCLQSDMPNNIIPYTDVNISIVMLSHCLFDQHPGRTMSLTLTEWIGQSQLT